MNEESLFHEALAKSAGPEREQFLAVACAERPELREAVEALLDAHAASGEFLGPAPGETANARNDTTDPEHAPAVAPELIPERIGRYAVRRLLGRGGMGVVYLAHDPQLDRLVALKVPKLAGPGAEERFLREARAAAAVTHPNLCPVFDAGRADGVLYLAMAYIPGPTLTTLLRQEGPLAPQRAAALATAIAAGMAEAHRHGIVHRDLKPGNVLLGKNGAPVVTDFGLARRGSATDVLADPNDTTTFDPRLTRAGMVMGTPAYMPPEQARGDVDKVGPASDVYALGAILYELLTGRSPFQADSVAELVEKIERDPLVPPSRRRPGLPARLDAICAKALAKNPAQRFASMDEFTEALASGGKRRRRTWAVVAAAAFALIALAGIIIYVKTGRGEVEVRLRDPNAKVEFTLDGDEIQLNDAGKITRIRVGEHKLVVRADGFETETKEFRIKRGDTTVVEVALKPRGGSAALPPPDRARLAALLARGRQLIEGGQYDAVGELADEALKIDSESPNALALRAFARNSLGDRSGALQDADAALRLNPETFVALIVRASLHARAGKPDEALADATAAARLEPKHPAPWAIRADLYLRKGVHRQTIHDASRAIEIGTRRSDPYVNRGAAYIMLGDYAKALADYNEAAERAPGDPQVFAQRSAVNAKLGHAEKAGADWVRAKQLNPALDVRPAVPAPQRPTAAKKLSADEAKKLEQALAAFDRAFDRGDLAGCSAAAEEACRVDPTCPAARSARARVWAQEKRHKDAITEATEAIRLDPDDAWAYVSRSAARIGLKEYAAGVVDATVAIRLDEQNWVAWNNRAWAYLRRGQHRQAIFDATESIRLRPQYDLAYDMRGTAYAMLGEYEKSLADYEMAAKAQPKNARWHMICSALRAHLNDPDGAKRERQLAVKIDPRLANAPDEPMPPASPPVKKDPE